MGTITGFNPQAAGFRVASPIRRKPRTPSTRPAPKPQYADAVWYSFNEGTPLEATVRTSAVEDTVRRLKRAARYLERTHRVEVRVQISAEPVMVQDKDPGGQPLFDKGEPVMVPAKPAKTVVKFLGHAPFMLGRRISQARAQELGAAAPEAPAPTPARHRRTVAADRATHRKTALRHAVVWSVITRPMPSCPLWDGYGGIGVFAKVSFDQSHEFSLLATCVTDL